MRKLTIGLVAVVALSGAALADRLSPARGPAPGADRAGTPGGVWVCPVVKAPTTSGWIHLVNTAEQPAQVRITFIPDRARPVEQLLTAAPRRALTVATPASITRFAAGAIVEYGGGDVTVSRSAMLANQGATAIAAAPCARPGPAHLVVPQGETLRSDTQIAMLNPGSADALVDIALLVEGERLEPESLQRRIVPARGRLVIREGDFAFDEAAVAASIIARSGRVVAEGVLLGANLFEIAPAQAATHELVALASTARGAAQFRAVNVADEDAVTAGTFISSAGQTTYEPLATGLAPDTPKVGGPPAQGAPAGAVALAVTSETAPIAIGARWIIGRRSGAAETAASAGVQPAHRAVAVLGPPVQTSAMRLLIVNPDPDDATVSVTLFTPAGATRPPPLQALRLGGGTATAVSVPDLPSTATVGIELTSRGGRIVAALEGQVSLRIAPFSAFAVTATPVLPAPPVAVEPDPRQGVPAQ